MADGGREEIGEEEEECFDWPDAGEEKLRDDEGLWWGTFADDRRGGGSGPAVGGAIQRALRARDRRSRDSVVVANVADAFMRKRSLGERVAGLLFYLLAFRLLLGFVCFRAEVLRLSP